jgi:hypothetical protein
VSIFRQSGALHLERTGCRYCAQPAIPGESVCELHFGEVARLLADPRRAGYRSAAYRAARRAALRRAKGHCEACGKRLPHRANGRIVAQTHHIDGNPQNNTPENLLVCGTCCHDGARRPAV